MPGEDDDWQFGTGAGFYLDATADKYAKNYRMRAHIIEELPSIVKAAGNIPLVCAAQSSSYASLADTRRCRTSRVNPSSATAWEASVP